jgi:hypothetical protein
MGFFSRKKKTSSPSPALASSSSSLLPSPPVVPEDIAPVEPPITLSVVFDGWRQGRDTHCFTLKVGKETSISMLRQALAAKLGDVSMSLFKVSFRP